MAQTRGTKHQSSLEPMTNVHDYGASKQTYSNKAAAHVGISHGEVGLQNGLLKDEVNGSLQPVLRVDLQFFHLLYQSLKLLRRQFVQDTAKLLQHLVSLGLFEIVFHRFFNRAAA